NDVVAVVKGVGADCIRSEIRIHIVPIGTGAADCNHGSAKLVVSVSRAQQTHKMTINAIIVIKKTVPDENRGRRPFDTCFKNFRLCLCRHSRRANDAGQNKTDEQTEWTNYWTVGIFAGVVVGTLDAGGSLAISHRTQ